MSLTRSHASGEKKISDFDELIDKENQPENQKSNQSPAKKPDSVMLSPKKSPRKPLDALYHSPQKIGKEVEKESKENNLTVEKNHFAIRPNTVILPMEKGAEHMDECDSEDSDSEIAEELASLNKVRNTIENGPQNKRKAESISAQEKTPSKSKKIKLNSSEEMNSVGGRDAIFAFAARNLFGNNQPAPAQAIPEAPTLRRVPLNLELHGFFQSPAIPVQLGLQAQPAQPQATANHMRTRYGNALDEASPLNCDRGFIKKALF